MVYFSRVIAWLFEKEVNMTDLFDSVNKSPKPDPDATPDDGSQVLVEVPAETDVAEVIEETGDEAGPEDTNDDDGSDETPKAEAAPAGELPAEKKADAPKQVNVVEEDPYEFDKCLITVAMALMPDDGSPDGRKVMLGVRNHQDEPILATCRLSDLIPLPDPIQKLLEQLKEQLPARSEKATERKTKAAEAKKKLISKPKAKTAPVTPKKAEKPKATTMNLFDMFDK
jgi:hypothetical protein